MNLHPLDEPNEDDALVIDVKASTDPGSGGLDPLECCEED